jgi:hypothetical protein
MTKTMDSVFWFADHSEKKTIGATSSQVFLAIILVMSDHFIAPRQKLELTKKRIRPAKCGIIKRRLIYIASTISDF